MKKVIGWSLWNGSSFYIWQCHDPIGLVTLNYKSTPINSFSTRVDYIIFNMLIPHSFPPFVNQKKEKITERRWEFSKFKWSLGRNMKSKWISTWNDCGVKWNETDERFEVVPKYRNGWGRGHCLACNVERWIYCLTRLVAHDASTSLTMSDLICHCLDESQPTMDVIPTDPAIHWFQSFPAGTDAFVKKKKKYQLIQFNQSRPADDGWLDADEELFFWSHDCGRKILWHLFRDIFSLKITGVRSPNGKNHEKKITMPTRNVSNK